MQNLLRGISFAVLSLLLISAATVRSQTTVFYTFSDGYLPHWNYNGTELYNCTGTHEYSLFTPANGLLQQRLSATPTCQAFFYGGSLPQGQSSGAGLDRWLPTYVEARLAVVGGLQQTSGSVGIPIMWLHTVGRSQLVVDLTTGTVGIEHAGGIAWTAVAGGLSMQHTYRIEMQPNAGIPTVTLLIDGITAVGPLLATIDWIYDGWGFGDGSPNVGDAIDIDWDYYAITQHPPGIGMANTATSMLFAYSNYALSKGNAAPGLAGPFRTSSLSGNGLTLEWSGTPGSPFALLLAPSLGQPRPFGCGGSLDIGTLPGFADIAIAFNPTIPVLGTLFTLSSSGFSLQQLAVPPLPTGTLLGAIQGVVFAPGPCGYKLTAAFELRS